MKQTDEAQGFHVYFNIFDISNASWDKYKKLNNSSSEIRNQNAFSNFLNNTKFSVKIELFILNKKFNCGI